MPIYPSNNTAKLASDLYFFVFEKRGVKFIRIKRSKSFKNLNDLEIEVSIEHTWAANDKLFKLSQKYYGTKDYWWIIGLVNKKPTDGHCKIGDVLLIPLEPNVILEELR